MTSNKKDPVLVVLQMSGAYDASTPSSPTTIPFTPTTARY